MTSHPASYYRALRARHAAGDPPMVPAEPVRAHLRRLAKIDVSPAMVAAVSGVPRCSVSDALHGKYGSITAVTAREILAVTLDRVLNDPIPPSMHVPKAGAVRRVQALLLAGHRNEDLAARSGVNTNRILVRSQCRTVTRATHDAVVRLYLDLRGVPGTSSRTARRAVKAGYLPLSAWDDADDPRSLVGGVAGPADRPRRPAAELVAEVELVLGEPLHVAAARIGVAEDTLVRALERHRPDLLRRLREASARWQAGGRRVAS